MRGVTIQRKDLRRVRAGPHGARRIVQDFGRDRSEQQAPETAIAMRRHHDEIGMLRRGALDDLGGGFTVLYPASTTWRGPFPRELV